MSQVICVRLDNNAGVSWGFFLLFSSYSQTGLVCHKSCLFSKRDGTDFEDFVSVRFLVLILYSSISFSNDLLLIPVFFFTQKLALSTFHIGKTCLLRLCIKKKKKIIKKITNSVNVAWSEANTGCLVQYKTGIYFRGWIFWSQLMCCFVDRKKNKTLFTWILFRTITFTRTEEFKPFFHFYQSIFSDTKTPQSFPEAQNANSFATSASNPALNWLLLLR